MRLHPLSRPDPLLLWIALVLAGLAARPAPGEDGPPKPVAWLSGPAARQQLQQPVSLAWADVPLAISLERLAQAERVAIVLDRRVDPGRRVDATFDDQPLEAILAHIAQQQGIGFTTLDAVVYLGPLEVSRPLRTLSALGHEQAARAAAGRKRELLERRPWRWDDLATPRDLLAQLEREAGVKIERMDLVPHDLWRAADLPPLAWIDRLLLVVAQFDLGWELAPDGGVRLTPLDHEARLTRTYPGHGQAESLAGHWRTLAPDAKIEADGDRIVVLGRVEEQQQLEAASHPANGKHPLAKWRAGIRVYQLTVEQATLESLLRQLGKQLELEFEFDEPTLRQSGRSLDQIVTFKVKDATLDELLSAMLHPAGLDYSRKDRHVKITPAAKP